MKEVNDILESFGVSLKEDLQAELLRKGVETNAGQNSRLGNSIKFYYKPTNEGTNFYLSMNDYWEPVDKGRGKGKTPPPINPIIAWLKKKGVDPFKKELSFRQIANRQRKESTIKNLSTQDRRSLKKMTREKALKSMAFAISKNVGKKGTIKRFGYHGANFFEPVLNDGRIQKLEQDLAVALGKNIKVQLINGI